MDKDGDNKEEIEHTAKPTHLLSSTLLFIINRAINQKKKLPVNTKIT